MMNIDCSRQLTAEGTDIVTSWAPVGAKNLFHVRTLDRDSSGTIGFMELMLALDLVGADK